MRIVCVVFLLNDMYKRLFVLLLGGFIVFLLVTLSSCQEKFEMFDIYDLENATLPKTKKMEKLTTSDFNKIVVGHGWKETQSYLILDRGGLDSVDYWKNREGGAPEYHEFKPEKVITYYWDSSVPALTHRERQYSYDESENIITFDGFTAMRVIHWSPSEMKVVKRAGVTYDDKKKELKNVFLYVTLKTMTSEELATVRNTFQ